MSSTGSVLVGLLVFALVGYFAYRIRRERRLLREKITIFRQQDDRLITSVEELVLSGRLAPVKAS